LADSKFDLCIVHIHLEDDYFHDYDDKQTDSEKLSEIHKKYKKENMSDETLAHTDHANLKFSGRSCFHFQCKCSLNVIAYELSLIFHYSTLNHHNAMFLII